ncbi:MAG: hypothetical protein JRJ66_02235 [Deltaproteobacteria bacterium]|nr:hypothetical protein [Deltaproteobacteria bacterium]
MSNRHEAFNKSQELYEKMFREALEAERKLRSGRLSWRRRMIELDKKIKARR